MSKMNLKSTLWTLAFAVAAVSCSDELEEGGGTGTGNEENGEGVYVTVNVSTTANPMTKTNGEGEATLEDSEAESAVHDINIFLIPNATQTEAMTKNDLTKVNDLETTAIVSGYSTNIQAATGSINEHDAKATVQVSVPDLNQWYHVVTVVNAGDDLGFTQLGQLRDYLQKAVWDGDNKYAEDGNGGAHNFVMSTHQMWQNGVGGSDLYVTEANSNPNNPAETTAYVERLAARIDMQLASGLKDGTASPTNKSEDKVKITGYQVVNQLVYGTYMLKRVTGNVASVTGKIEDIEYDHPYPYLSDELWGNGNFNYVLDPWTKGKNVTDWTAASIFIPNSGAYWSGTNGNYTQTAINGVGLRPRDLYKNHFDGGLNGQTGFMDFLDIPSDIKTSDSFTPLLYVQENTTDVDQQKNGFSTGVIFEAEYAPKLVSQYNESGSGTGTYPKVEVVAYKAGNSFLQADFGHVGKKVLSADMRTIAALGLAEGSNSDIMKAMFNESGDWSSLSSKDDAQTVVRGMSGGPLIVAFKAYLQGILDGIDENTEGKKFADVKANLTWSKFVEASHTASNGIKYVPSDTELTNGIDATNDEDGKTAVEVREELMENYNIAYYAAGTSGAKSYYKYWIKHDPNGTDDDPMGVMEFAIVRNNVYQLGISSIRDLGDPLPFTPGKDDPDNPDKDGETYIVVQLYVRNWVVRSNSGITL